jgi:hypothetical protein
MSKNLTLKGAALGALVALSISAVAPASAAGLADNTFVSLVPTTGTEYSVIAGNAKEFKLSANEATSIAAANRNVKFLITDTAAAIEPKRDETSNYTTGTFNNWSRATTTVTVTEANTFAIGDVIYVSGMTTTAGTAAPADGQYTVLTADSSTFTFAAATGTNTDAQSDNDAGTAELVRSKRAADNSYVVDSGVAANVADELLTLAQGNETVSRTVTVTAWVDANGNRLIDSTEYASPTRTVKFVAEADLVASTTLTPIVGDDALSASVAFTPTLNGEQELAQGDSFLNVGFTRQDDATVLYANDSNAGVSAQTSVWNDTTKLFTVKVLTDADSATAGSSSVDGNTDAGWALDGADDQTPSGITHVSGVLTATYTAHKLRVGDKVLFGGSITSDVAATQTLLRGSTAFTVASVPSANTFTLAVAGSSTIGGTLSYTVETYTATSESIVDRVFAGTYTAQAYVNATAIGAKATAGTAAVAAATTTVSTVGSASVQGKSFTAVASNTTKVKTGTLSVPVSIAVTDADGVAVSAGRPVVVTLSGAANDTFKVNAKSTTDTVYTDASGKATVTVTAGLGIATAAISVKAVAEGTAEADIDLLWEDQAYGLIDFNTTAASVSGTLNRALLKGGSYTLDLAVADQFFQAAPADTYRLKISGSGSAERYQTLTSGKAAVTITDSGITSVGSTFTTTIVLEKATNGVFATASTLTVVNTVIAAPTVSLGAAGSTIYGNAVVTSAAVAAKALVEIDKRKDTTVTPAYVTKLVLNGAVISSTTSAGIEGAAVTVSGSSSLLFSNGQVAKRGSLTFTSAASTGAFEVEVYSTSTLTDSVVTFTAGGVSSTVKVSFTGIGVGEGTSLTATAPAKVAAASTFQVSAKLADAYGNGVAATAGRVKVTYTGAGIVFGTLPDKTDATGALSFSALLGAADKGLVTVTVQYDQNGDADFVDAKDLTVVKNILVGVSASASAGIKKANVVVKNASGLSVTVVSGTKSVTKVATSNSYKLSLTKLTKGSKTVKVYVNDILVASKKVSVK